MTKITENNLKKIKILLSALYNNVEKRSNMPYILGCCKSLSPNWDNTLDILANDSFNCVVFTMDTWYDGSCHSNSKNCSCVYGNCNGSTYIPVEYFTCSDEEFQVLMETDPMILKARDDLKKKNIERAAKRKIEEEEQRIKELELLSRLKAKYEHN